jgi:hypothetical protein
MFVSFKKTDDSPIKIDVNKLIAYEPSGNRAYPSEEYTALFFAHSVIYVNEPFASVDEKVMTAEAID